MQRHFSKIQSLPGLRARTLAGASFLIVGLAVAHTGVANAQSLSSAGTSAVATYESVGLYWQSPGGTGGCEVKYRKVSEAAWASGLPLWYDARDGQCRGSIVGLTQNTTYEVQLNLPGQAASRGLSFQTWANAKPIAQTIAVPSGSAQYNITQSGTPSGWIVYEGNGATLDGQNTATYNINVKAKYVIIRGLNLKGAKQDAIRLDPTSSDVVIEDNDISNWGRTRDGTWATNMDSGIRGYCTSQDQLPRITIQRNKIHDPRYGANSWSDGHPAGAQAVAFSHCAGQLVIRHNDMYSTTGKYFNDIIGGEDNFTQVGFPNADSDIYGNKLSHAWDDGIESEGANENVRIWGNYIDRTAIGVATTATSVGPVYVFRNVWNRAQMFANVASLDLDERQPFFKSGGTDTLGHGRRYLLHNTMLQARQAGLLYGLGGGAAAGGTGSTQLVTNTFSKNNIYHLWKDGKGAFYQTGSQNEFAADLYNGTSGSATVVGGISGTPVYLSGHGWQNEGGGSYQLASNSPGFGKGVKIANFNDGVSTPDVGAHQSGSAAMKFGVVASPGSSIAGSPVGAAPTGTNFALASAGAVASASSQYGPGYAAANVINNERAGSGWGSTGGWSDGNGNSWPDWVQVQFNGAKTIDRVVVYTVQDNYASPVEPTNATTFSRFGVTNFTVQGWNGSAWVALGTVTGNNLAKRTVTFAGFTTDRIRISVTGGGGGYSRLTEIEAWGVPAGGAKNVALAANGATATASSQYGPGYAAASVINNERAGRGWGSTGGWADGNGNIWGDWVQVQFNGTKTIDRVVVFTVQDNYANPVEPTDTTTVSQYGLLDFTVQGLVGGAWVTLGTVSGNNLAKRTVTFSPAAMDRIRVNVTGGRGGYARLTEIEAW